jgi:hypothetical protein
MANEATMWLNLTPVIVGGLIGIAGSVIGIIGSFATSVYLESIRREAERKSLTGAIVGEISALLEISERRRYVEALSSLIAMAKAGHPDISYSFVFSVRRNPFIVYDANLSRIGILRVPLPRKIARFYAQASSILEDIADMREDKFRRDHDESIRVLEGLLKLFEDTHSLGREIIADAD